MAHKWRSRAAGGELPSREEILAFIAENPNSAGKREIARAFGISGAARIALKRLLKELEDEGVVGRRGRRLEAPGVLPPVLVALAVGRDGDGELIAEPEAWDENLAGPAPSIIVQPERGRRSGPAAGVGDRVLLRLSQPHRAGEKGPLPARVIKVLEKRPSAILGVYRETPRGGLVEPVDRRQRTLTVASGDAMGAHEGDLVEVAVSGAGRRGPGRARILERVGNLRSEKAVSLIAIKVHGIPHVFPDSVLEEAAAARPLSPDRHHEDWRDLPLVTIDPDDAKDHDDAVHAQPDPDPENVGGHIVTVAIADVSWYVRPGSALDREALRRGNSVYFPDRVVPMLPERISNDLCSLREGEDRPAIAVRMVFGADGRKRRHSFHRIVMRSAARLTYAQAQSAIDGAPDDKTAPLLEAVLRPLWAAYEVLRRGRETREPLELDIPERRIILKADGTVERVMVPERLDAHRLIEEFMIQANVAAAESLEAKGSPLLYRIHDQPSPAKLESLRDFLSTIEINLPRQGTWRPSNFNRILARVAGSEHEQLINEVVLRTQAQAEYSPKNIGHFGLNLRRYAHFTSPIRRYADLVVHRGLVKALGLGPGGLPEGMEARLDAIGAEISAAERRAMAAERDTVDRLIAHYLADRIGATFTGRISGVTRAGLFVRLAETGADGFVPISTLGNDYFIHQEAAHALVGERTGETHRLGDEVRVRLVEAAPVAGALRFELLSEGRYQEPPVRGARRVGRHRPGRSGPRGRRRG